MATYVDGMVVAEDKADCDKLREYLIKSFPVNDLIDLKHRVGCMLECNRKLGSMTVSQLASIDRLLLRIITTASSPIPAC